MTRDEVARKLRFIVGEQTGHGPDEITSEKLLSDLDVDSLDMIEIAMEIEEEFQIDELDFGWSTGPTPADVTFGQLIDFVIKSLP